MKNQLILIIRKNVGHKSLNTNVVLKDVKPPLLKRMKIDIGEPKMVNGVVSRIVVN